MFTNLESFYMSYLLVESLWMIFHRKIEMNFYPKELILRKYKI